MEVQSGMNGLSMMGGKKVMWKNNVYRGSQIDVDSSVTNFWNWREVEAAQAGTSWNYV